MRFSEEFLRELRARVDIVDLVGRYTEIRQPGSRNPKALCPFHNEKTPSFILYPHNQSFYCFGCGIGGNAIHFIQNIEHLSFPEAVQFLCQRVGMPMPAEQVDDAYTAMRRRCFEANRAAARYFHACLKAPGGEAARAYLQKRALKPETVTRFGLGFAGDSWDGLKKHLMRQGFAEDELVAFNLCRRSAKGTVYDAFRSRLMFPIIDLMGNVVAFGGRVLDDTKPKYLNTADTPVFKKGQGVYALNFAKNNKEGVLILCEGYMDVIAMHQAGYTNAVAGLGTAFTPEQISLLSRHCRELILCYDADEAGQKATERSLRLLAASSMELRVARLEGGKDPDEILRTEGKGKMDLLLSRASGSTAFELERVAAGIDLSTDEGRVRYVNAAVEVLARVGNPVERDLYITRTAERAGTGKAPLAQMVEAARKKRGRRAEYESFRRDAEAASGALSVSRGGVIHNPEKRDHLLAANAEETILASLLKNPDYLTKLRGRLTPDVFITSVNRSMFEDLAKRILSGREADLSMYQENAENEQVSYLAYLYTLGDSIAGTLRECEECVDTLLSCRVKEASVNAAGISDAEFVRMIREKGSRRTPSP